MGLRVLITNIRLADRSGTELYVLDLALELLRRGHRPVVYSPEPGPLAEELRARTVPVISDLEQLGEPPDVIHGHHATPTLVALCWFPRAPAIYFCHDWGAWHDEPPRHPRIRRWVAVDETCYDRLVARSGIDAARATTIHNFVDLGRFASRPPLPERPSKALVFSNYVREGEHLEAVRAACAARGIELTAVGLGVGAVEREPEAMLGGYDIVLAKGKAAMEALATGCAVVLCDKLGLGPMVTAASYERMRSLNFGRRSLQGEVTAEDVGAELDRYDAADARAVSERVRRECSLTAAVDRLLALYAEVVAEHDAAASDPDAELKALGRMLLSRPAPEAVAIAVEQASAELRHRLGEAERRVARLERKWHVRLSRWLHALLLPQRRERERERQRDGAGPARPGRGARTMDPSDLPG